LPHKKIQGLNAIRQLDAVSPPAPLLGRAAFCLSKQLDQLLRSNEPGSLDKALRLTAQYLETSPEDIVAQSCSRPVGSLREKLGRLGASCI
jgi:hypothetical protein